MIALLAHKTLSTLIPVNGFLTDEQTSNGCQDLLATFTFNELIENVAENWLFRKSLSFIV